jgi:hypothetical protein
LSLLEQAARMTIADDVPRKMLVYITPFCNAGESLFSPVEDPDGFLIPSGQQSHFDLLDMLRRANVAVYALDPRGKIAITTEQLAAQDIVSGADPVRPAVSSRSANPVAGSQEGLRGLTAVTGGVAVTGTDDFDAGLDRIARDLADYYILGFQPPQTKSGQYRSVEVQVNRPGLTARFRPGYVTGATSGLKVDKDPLVRLSVGALPAGDMPLSLFASAWPASGNDKPVLVVVEMTVPRAELRQAATLLTDDVEISVLAVRTSSGKLVRHVRSRRQIALARTGSEEATFQVSTVVDLQPASYQLRVSARSAATGRAASVYLPVTVDEPASRAFDLGGLVLGYLENPAAARTVAASDRSRLPFSPTMTRSFKASDKLQLLCPLWKRNGGTAVKITAELLDDLGAVARRFDAPVRATRQMEFVQFTLGLGKLPAGEYRIRVTATDGAASVTRQVGITVDGERR